MPVYTLLLLTSTLFQYERENKDAVIKVLGIFKKKTTPYL
jgi:hypothetical protein